LAGEFLAFEHLTQGALEGHDNVLLTIELAGIAPAPIEGEPGIDSPVPPKKTLPTADEPSDFDYGELMDQWFANKEEASARANVDTQKLQQRIRDIVGTRLFGEKARRIDAALLLYIDLKGRQSEIDAWYGYLTPDQQALVDESQNLTNEQRQIAEDIIKLNEESGEKSQEAGILKSVRDNYIARIWNLEKKRGFFAFFRKSSGHQKARTLDSVLQGWVPADIMLADGRRGRGLQLRVPGATNAHLIARTEMSQVIEDRNLVSLAEKSGVLSTNPAKLQDPVQVQHPNFTSWKWRGELGEEGKLYSNSMAFASPEGGLFVKQPLYAESEVAKQLNTILKDSALKGIPLFDFLSKWNAIIKNTILTTGLFHPVAFFNSYVLGSRGVRPVAGYKAGKKALMNFTPAVRDLVRGGMTVGRVQDFDQAAMREATLIGKIIDKVPVANWLKRKLLALRDHQIAFLFNKLGPYLKVQAGLLEYHQLLRKHADALASGDMTTEQLAKQAAELMNKDFGGLNLQRMGRNQTTQHIARLLFLAPDWTESNILSMTGAFKLGQEGKIYRAFWARVALKGLGATVLFNILMASMDDELDFWERYEKAWEEGRLRWLDVDVTPAYNAVTKLSGGEPSGSRKYWALIGHFKDPVKFVTQHPVKTAKDKGSVLTTTVVSAVTGTDWAGRPYTTVPELFGVDDKGLYQTDRPGKYAKGQPKGGKLAGQLVGKTRGSTGPITVSQTPSFLMERARASTPIQVQKSIAFLLGEIDWFDWITQSSGLRTSTTYPVPPPPRKRRRATTPVPVK